VTAPFYLVAAGLLAAAVTALHFIVFREPPGEQLPTARFIPVGRSIVRMVATAPNDRLLLALRVAAILLIGLAFAGPRLPQRRVPLLSIVAIDRSSAVHDVREVADSAREWLATPTGGARRSTTAAASVLIAFDSTASVVDGSVADTLDQWRRSAARGSLTAALVTARRVAARWVDRADSIEVTVVSPARDDEVDAALPAVRALWPGGVRLVRVSAEPAGAHVTGGRPTIDWPADGHVAGASPRATVDTVGALVVGDLVAVRAFERRWQPDTTGARVVGRWVDGEAAVIERQIPTGCTRDVAVAADTAQDQLRHPVFARLVRALQEPCGSAIGSETRAPPPELWRTSGGAVRIAAIALGPPSGSTSRLPVVLLALALLALMVELLLRTPKGGPAVAR
jgi:hypothetical protein